MTTVELPARGLDEAKAARRERLRLLLRTPTAVIGAVVVAFVAFRIAARRRTGLAGGPIDLPQTNTIDARLIGGSAIFGVGWGLVGLCPGPAIANLGFLEPRAALFVICMIVGMGLYRLLAAAPPSPAAYAEASLHG